MIRLSNLTRRYGETVAVRDVSVEIERGEIVGLLGHNGAGKTTVMKMLTGFLEPTSGTASVDGHDVVAERTRVQERLGYLPENAPLYPEMLVHEYLRMVGELRGVSDVDGALWRAARRTGLLEHLERPIAALSKGYRQRVGIAQAILHAPDVLVLDEPTNGLDPMQIESIRELVRDLGRTSTVILSTHILQEVEAVCDRVLVMIGGELVADARLEDLLSSDRVRLRAEGVDPSAIAAIDGVVDVRRVSEDGGITTWSLATAEGADPIPAVVAACASNGWAVHEVARETRTLEQVFRELQARHAGREVA